eukprot:gene9209-1295_t
MKLNSKIDSNHETLEEYHKHHKWIPNKQQIRPSLHSKKEKEYFLQNVNNNFHSNYDYILKTIFKVKSQRIDGKHKIDKDHVFIEKQKIFLPNKFPYQLEEGNHYVMWYSYESETEENITNDISLALTELVGENNFEFIWYENPKMSIPEVSHYQVFWNKK